MPTLKPPVQSINADSLQEALIVNAIEECDKLKLLRYLVSNVMNIMRSNNVPPAQALEILLQRGVINRATVH